MNMNFWGGHYSAQYTVLDPYGKFPFRLFLVDVPLVSPAQRIKKGGCYVTSPLSGDREDAGASVYIYLLTLILWTYTSTLTGSHAVLDGLGRSFSMLRVGGGMHL